MCLEHNNRTPRKTVDCSWLRNCVPKFNYWKIMIQFRSLLCIRKFNCSPQRTTAYRKLIFFWWNTKVTTMRKFTKNKPRVKEKSLFVQPNQTKFFFLFFFNSNFDWKYFTRVARNNFFFFSFPFYFIDSKLRSKAK